MTLTDATKYDIMAEREERLRKIAENFRRIGKKTGKSAVELGLDLLEAKKLCEIGRWKEWLRENFPYSDRTAQRFMEIAREEDLPQNLDRYQSTALSRLKNETEEVKEICQELAEQGETITPAKIEKIRGDLKGLFEINGEKAEKDPANFKRQDVELRDIRHLTAIQRSNLSTPFRVAIERGSIEKKDSIFDYGCGRAGDIIFLRLKGYEITGFDPFFFPLNPLRKSDIVTLNYVINVIEDPIERASVLKTAYELARKRLICAIRTDPAPSVVLPHGDGHIVSTGCFQKHYTQESAKDFLKEILKKEPIALDSGIFEISKY